MSSVFFSWQHDGPTWAKRTWQMLARPVGSCTRGANTDGRVCRRCLLVCRGLQMYQAVFTADELNWTELNCSSRTAALQPMKWRRWRAWPITSRVTGSTWCRSVEFSSSAVNTALWSSSWFSRLYRLVRVVWSGCQSSLYRTWDRRAGLAWWETCFSCSISLTYPAQ